MLSGSWCSRLPAAYRVVFLPLCKSPFTCTNPRITNQEQTFRFIFTFPYNIVRVIFFKIKVMFEKTVAKIQTRFLRAAAVIVLHHVDLMIEFILTIGFSELLIITFPGHSRSSGASCR